MFVFVIYVGRMTTIPYVVAHEISRSWDRNPSITRVDEMFYLIPDAAATARNIPDAAI